MPDDEHIDQSETKNYYGVANGRKLGIYTDWGLCQNQTNRYPRALFKGFAEIDDCN